jgi:hypothetical protein
LHGRTSAAEAAARRVSPHPGSPERAILQSAGFAGVRTAPMLSDFGPGHEHHETQHFAGEHGEAQNVFHVSIQSVGFEH